MPNPLPETGLLRASQIVGRKATKRKPALPALIPVSRATWYDGVRTGRFPQPVRLGGTTVAWRAEDIRELIENGVPDAAGSAPGPEDGDQERRR